MKHRKLFPICPDVCNPTCPSDCYPYFPPPPPSPPPPPLSPPLSTKHSQNISPYVVIIATLLIIVFLVVSYYLIIVKNWFRPRTTQLEDTDDSFGDENRGLAIDHPIWYIRTVGLQQSIINSIAVVKYKKGESLIEGTDCSICLNEFQDDEILRLLPKCKHSFHIPCIDTWLRSHTTCPVCRSGIVHTDTQDRTNNDNQSRETESTVTDGGLSNNQAGNVDENRTIIDDESEFRQVGIDEQAETSNIRVDSDENDIVHDEMQQMRRSISADSLFVEKMKLAMVKLSIHENAHKYEPGEDNSSKSKTPSRHYDGPSASLHQGSVPMKRSSSCGGRSFFSRHSRNLNSVLPL